VLAACVVNARGEVVRADFGSNNVLWRMRHGPHVVETEITPDASNFNGIALRLRQIDPTVRTKPVEIPILKNQTMLGRLRLLISESDIYREIEADAREITRRLWSVVLAFVGVLGLALYLMARLFHRQIHLLQENEKLDRMAYVGTLASGLAHEIRNPLNAMSVNLSVAEEELAASNGAVSPTAGRALGLLRREIGRLNRTVGSFMEFAHPSVERRERTRLRPLVNEVLDLLQPQIEESGTEVEVDVPEDAELLADFSGLRQVLYNVILNAIQAMSGAGKEDGPPRRLSIGGRRESAQWLLWVEDTGPGIPAGDEDRIFEVFHSTKAAGSGFGLSIARAIIASHDGDIRPRRREEGGLRIEITLPETGPRAARRA
jgi:signal transduction histidine kinase